MNHSKQQSIDWRDRQHEGQGLSIGAQERESLGRDTDMWACRDSQGDERDSVKESLNCTGVSMVVVFLQLLVLLLQLLVWLLRRLIVLLLRLLHAWCECRLATTLCSFLSSFNPLFNIN